jgi:two-component system response regulator LytT
MRILIVEDEAVVARRLSRMAGLMAGKGSTVEVADSLDQARRALELREIDLLFLDLNINGDDGFGLLEEAAARSFQTVVVSAHHDQALRAFEFGVTDFVAKPWSEERLRKAIDRVRTRESAARGKTRRLVVRKGRDLLTIEIAQILFIRAADDYSELHLADGSELLSEKSLAALEGLLPSDFLRVHRSYIANMSHVARLRTTPREALITADGAVVPVGRMYREAVRERVMGGVAGSR